MDSTNLQAASITKRSLFVGRTFICALGLLLGACSKGGSQPSPPASPPEAGLAGAWLGVLEDSQGDLLALSVAIDDAGNLLSFVVDGQSQGTGTAVALESGAFSFELSSGFAGCLHVDETMTYGFFLADDFSTGLIQKGATGLPRYFDGDIFDAWSGRSIFVDAGFSFLGTGPSVASFNPDGTFSVMDDGETFGTAMEGEMQLLDEDLGLYEGFAESTSGLRILRLLMSPDKQVLGGWFHPLDSVGQVFGYPQSGSFVLWQR